MGRGVVECVTPSPINSEIWTYFIMQNNFPNMYFFYCFNKQKHSIRSKDYLFLFLEKNKSQKLDGGGVDRKFAIYTTSLLKTRTNCP